MEWWKINSKFLKQKQKQKKNVQRALCIYIHIYIVYICASCSYVDYNYRNCRFGVFYCMSSIPSRGREKKKKMKIGLKLRFTITTPIIIYLILRALTHMSVNRDKCSSLILRDARRIFIIIYLFIFYCLHIN